MSTVPWLTNEDAALKLKLQGLTVFDGNAPNGRSVPVRYRLPETEVANLTFPILIISHNGWYRAPEREHRGFINLPYAPEGQPTWWDDSGGPSVATFDPNDSPYQMFFPIPYNFDYTVTLYARIMHEHTIPLVAALAAPDRLDPHFGFLDIPQDGTKRTLQLLGGPDLQTGKDSNGKRVFWVTYIVRVFSELVPATAQATLANFINLDLNVYTEVENLQQGQLIENHAYISTGIGSSWNVNQLTY